MIRSYKFQVDPNICKEQSLQKILFEYRRVAKIILNLQLNSFYKTGNIEFSHKLYQPIKTFLSERYKDVIKRQVDGILKSYISNRKNDFKKIVFNSRLNNDLKKELYIINKSNLWFEQENFLARKIFKEVLNRNRFPSVNNINMQLNTKVYDLQENKTSKSFAFWVKLRSCDENKNILIPLINNPYFNKFEGVVCNSIQLNFVNNKLTNVVLCKDIKDQKDSYTSKTDTIGIDIGLSTLIATDKGDLFSPNFMRKLIVYDKKIQSLQKELQKRGYKKLNSVSKRYSLFNKKLRAFIKNEVNRILNRIVKLYNPNSFAVEDLLFKNPNLSRRTNRLLSNFGLSIIKNKLKSLNEEYGIKVKYINPAYTSQTCSGCGYISEKNRRSRNTFKCRCCKLELDADVNGARVIKGRSLDERFTLKMSKNKILKLIVGDFVTQHKGKYSPLSWIVLNRSNNYFGSVV